MQLVRTTDSSLWGSSQTEAEGKTSVTPAITELTDCKLILSYDRVGIKLYLSEGKLLGFKGTIPC